MDRSLREDVAFIRWPILRLVCVLPAPENEKELDRSFEAWSAKLKEWSAGGKIAGRGIATQKLRVFFLCAQDLSLAECGPKGQWYEAKVLLKWAKKAKRSAKVGLFLAEIVFKLCIGLALPSNMLETALGIEAGGALSTLVTDSLGSGVETMASVAGENLERERPADLLQHAGAHRQGIPGVLAAPAVRSPIEQKSPRHAAVTSTMAVEPRITTSYTTKAASRACSSALAQSTNSVSVYWQRPAPLQGFAYELTDIMKDFEMDGRRGSSPFRSFDPTMKPVDRHGLGEEWARVTNDTAHQFKSK